MTSRSRDRALSPPAVATSPSDAALADGPPIWDVWSRTDSKYRIRASVLLVVNVGLFAGLCSFAFWLRTGIGFAPSMRHYWALFWQTFQPAGENRITLSDLLTSPISIYEVPLQIVILGLLLAALASIPILISILYRFWACIPFLAGVAFLAMMPWLAITLVGSCVLASVRPFRFSFRFASAMLGLVLVVIYFYSASRQSATAPQILSSPSDRIKFVAPWVLAIIASCVVFAIVLVLARVVNYRPGAVAPLLAVMFAAPVVLFEVCVGRDELHYRLLENRYGPASGYFDETNVAKEYEHALYTAWKAHPDPKPSFNALDSHQQVRWELELVVERQRCTIFGQRREEAVRACTQFLYHHPDSRYAPNALYIQAKALDTRVDLSAFRFDRVIRFYDSFPSAASRHPWEKLHNARSESPMAAVAALRLAQLDAREHNPRRAVERLRWLIDEHGGAASAATQPLEKPPGHASILTPKPPESNLRVPVEFTVFEARRLRSLIEANRDPRYGEYVPLCGPPEPTAGGLEHGLLQLDPRDVRYVSNLEALLERYPGCELADNIELEIAKATSDPETRAALLEACIDHYPSGDALPEALYHLGLAYQALNRGADARRAFQRVVAEFADSAWYPQAENHLRLAPAPVESDSDNV